MNTSKSNVSRDVYESVDPSALLMASTYQPINLNNEKICGLPKGSDMEKVHVGRKRFAVCASIEELLAQSNAGSRA